MSASILNGKAIAETLCQQVTFRITEHLKQKHRKPGLAVILVGSDSASEVYVKNKLKACESVGIESHSFILPSTTLESHLLELIDELNEDTNIDGILVQLPLPSQIDSGKLVERIHPNKDVDGFHPYNIGRLAQKRPLLRPCTPYGIMQLLETTQLKLKGLKAAVIGVSNIVGR